MARIVKCVSLAMVPSKANRPARQRQFESEVAEARALERGVKPAAPARKPPAPSPPGLQHRVRPPAGVASLERQAAQKIRGRATREK